MKNIVLIDYENVQPEPKSIDALYALDFDIYLFVGPQQKNTPTGLLLLKDKFSQRLQTKRIKQMGKNALDLYIALKKMPNNRPKKLETLENTIRACTQNFKGESVEKIIAALKDQKFLTIDKTRTVSYL